MATSEQLAAWIVKNQDKQGTPDFETVAASYKALRSGDTSRETMQPAQPAEQPGFIDRSLGQIKQGAIDTGKNILAGAADIGATLMSPFDAMGMTSYTPSERRQSINDFAGDSGVGQTARVLTNIAGTAGAPNLLAKGVAKVAPLVPEMYAAIRSGGFTTGLPAARALSVQGAKNAAIRVSGGAGSAAAMQGMVDPEHIGIAAGIGGALPGAAKLAGLGGQLAGKAFTASPEVAQLAQKAKALGIDIPADRLANSKMLDAAAASLNYVPFSGRIATETKMNNQIKKALSNTFGENTPHLSKDLISKTQNKLGAEFDKFLTGNTVKVDQQLWTDLQGNLAKAQNELSADNYRIVENQVKDLWSKVNNGEIDGQAAYNVKKTLDRLGRGNGNEAFHAKQVRDSLMNGVLRSVQPDEAAAFTALKRKYANLKTVEKLAGNTAEGDISMARLGNLDSKNPEVSDIAKIAATFAKGRESPHGAMQRVTIGGGVTALGGGLAAGVAAPVAAGLTGGRLANMALNSNAVKKMILAQPKGGNRLADLLSNPAVRALPIALQSR